jgi:hypothetical protein
MNMEQSMEWELAGETEALGQTHKSHMTWPGSELGPLRFENQRSPAWTIARPGIIYR